MDNENKHLTEPQSPSPDPLQEHVEASGFDSNLQSQNLGQDLSPVLKHKKSLLTKIFLIIGIIVAVICVSGVGFVIYNAASFSIFCNSQQHKVSVDEKNDAKTLSQLTILTGQATYATGSGNTDCIDGGPNSVTASANFTTANTLSELSNQASSNLSHQGYKQISGPYVGNDNTTGTTITSLIWEYKKSATTYLDVSYNLLTPSNERCSNGAVVCSNPNLQEVYQGQVTKVSVTLLPYPFYTDVHTNVPK